MLPKHCPNVSGMSVRMWPKYAICDGYEWRCTLKYDDGTSKLIIGNVVPPPFSDDIEHRIKNLVSFNKTPWLFTYLGGRHGK